MAIEIYKPPFLRAYVLQDNGNYKIVDMKKPTIDSDGKLDSNAFIDVSNILPFRLGLEKRDVKVKKKETLYRLILAEPKKDIKLFTNSEKKDKLIDE